MIEKHNHHYFAMVVSSSVPVNWGSSYAPLGNWGSLSASSVSSLPLTFPNHTWKTYILHILLLFRKLRSFFDCFHSISRNNHLRDIRFLCTIFINYYNLGDHLNMVFWIKSPIFSTFLVDVQLPWTYVIFYHPSRLSLNYLNHKITRVCDKHSSRLN